MGGAARRGLARALGVAPGAPARPRRPDPRVPLGPRSAGLADIMLLDIRSRRDEPVREPEMSEPHRSMLGTEQRDWLLGELDDVAGGMAHRRDAVDLHAHVVRGARASRCARRSHKLKLIDEDGEGPDHDQWDGYPAERARLTRPPARPLDRGRRAPQRRHPRERRGGGRRRADGQPVAVELTSPSLTSQNLDEKLGVAPRDPAHRGLRGGVRGRPRARRVVRDGALTATWCSTSTDERVRAEWWHVDTVLERDLGVSLAAAFETPRGEPRLRRVDLVPATA